jgi:hypothetical protein
VLIYAVHQGAVDVELLLGVRGVADPNGPAAAVAAQVVELALGALQRAVDPVENLKAACRGPAGGRDAAWVIARGAERYDHVGEEREEVIGLRIKAEGVKR